MNDLFIDETSNTPAVFFMVKNGILNIAGKCLPEDPVEFFKQIENSIDEFINQHSDQLLVITCEFVYINTSSSKSLYNLLRKAVDNLKKVSIVWGHEEEDDDMLDQGKDYEDLLGIEFEFRIFSL
jgi:hypothetical protein